jgi:hypothetical protein
VRQFCVISLIDVLVSSLIGVEMIGVWLIWCWFNCWCLLNKISVVVWGHGGRCATVCRVAMVAVVPPFVVLILCWENYVENYVEKIMLRIMSRIHFNYVEKLWISLSSVVVLIGYLLTLVICLIVPKDDILFIVAIEFSYSIWCSLLTPSGLTLRRKTRRLLCR